MDRSSCRYDNCTARSELHFFSTQTKTTCRSTPTSLVSQSHKNSVNRQFVHLLYGQKPLLNGQHCFWGDFSLGIFQIGLQIVLRHCTNNDTPFMNPSSHPHLSVNQQERSSLQKEARLRHYRKNVQWQLRPIKSFPGSDEQRACWTKNFYYLEMITWGQKDDTSASRSHATDSWR